MFVLCLKARVNKHLCEPLWYDKHVELCD